MKWVCVVGTARMLHSKSDMEQTIHWPDGEFTLDAAVALNPALPQAVVRKKLSDAMAAKKIIQTRKGNGKIKGAFQRVKSDAEAGN